MHILPCIGSKFCVKFKISHKMLSRHSANYAYYGVLKFDDLCYLKVMASYVLVRWAPEVRLKIHFLTWILTWGLHGNLSRFTTTDATNSSAEEMQKPNYAKVTKTLVVWWIWCTVADVMWFGDQRYRKRGIPRDLKSYELLQSYTISLVIKLLMGVLNVHIE